MAANGNIYKQKRRRIQECMKDNAKEVMLNSRVSQSMAIRARNLNERSSTSQNYQMAFQVLGDSPAIMKGGNDSCHRCSNENVSTGTSSSSESLEDRNDSSHRCSNENVSTGTSSSSERSFASVSSVLDISSSNYTSSDDEQPDIQEFLREWYNSSKSVPRRALTELLKGLKAWFPELPADARTLLDTPRNVDVQPMGEGLFHHFGLKNEIINRLQTFEYTSYSSLNVDGMQLHNSTNDQFWPILCFLEEDPLKKPFAVSLFCGDSKPPLNEFLAQFNREMSDLQNGGLFFNNCHFNVTIRCFTCDAPARAFIKCTKPHNSYYGCDRCIQKGKWKNRVIFPNTTCQSRTNESFRAQEQQRHHKEESPLLELDIDMVNAFPHDYMHLVCLGVMRKLLMIWCGKAKTNIGKVSAFDKQYLNSFLSEVQLSFPCEFNRQPRPVKKLDYWKATEYRSFLLYLAPLCLKNVLPKETYIHFLHFFCGVTILISEEFCSEKNSLAAELLQSFVKEMPEHYGSECLVYNIHSLIHLSADAANFGPLDSFSAFPFENFLHSLKRMIFKSNQPLQQVVKKMHERRQSSICMTKKTQPKFSVGKRKRYSSIKSSVEGIHYSEIRNEKYKLNTKETNSYILANNDVFKVFSFVLDKNGEIFVVGKRFAKKQNYFSKPIHSSSLNIFKVKELSDTLHTFHVSEVQYKVFAIQYKTDCFLCTPLWHTKHL